MQTRNNRELAQILWQKILMKKVITRFDQTTASRLVKSKYSFERFVGRLALASKALAKGNANSIFANECSRDLIASKEYAHDLLFLLSKAPVAILSSTPIRKFIQKAARSKLDLCRENAAILLARMAKADRSALALLKKLRSDPVDVVRTNAEILLNQILSH